MTKVIFILHSLLGDGLMTLSVIKQYKEENPENELFLITPNTDTYRLYDLVPEVKHLSFPIEKVEEFKKIYGNPAGKLNKVYSDKSGFVFDAGVAYQNAINMSKARVHNNMIVLNAKHMSCGYAKDLNINLDSPHYDLILPEENIKWANNYLSNFKKPVIIVSTKSNSCSSQDKTRVLPANKMLDVKIWNDVIEQFSEDYDLVFSYAPGETPLEGLNEAHTYIGDSILNYAALLKECHLVVTIDNGTSHLAGAVNANITAIYGQVQPGMVGSYHTQGFYTQVDHTPGNTEDNLFGISTVTSREIIIKIQDCLDKMVKDKDES